MILSKRETAVLTAVVETYVETALPVSSQTLATGLGLSPASLRSTMAALTEKGYLRQPHTSAGRAPTVPAFRYYLDQVLKLGPLPRREQSRLHDHIQPGEGDLPQVLRRAVRTLSTLTRQVCVIMAPRQDLARWRQIDFVLLRPGMIMAVLVMHGGLVSNRLVQMDESLGANDLVHYGNYLNSLFEGRTTHEVRGEIERQLQYARRTLDAYRRAWELASQALAEEEQPEVFVGGTSHLTDQPEFTELETIQELLRLIEERSRLLELLDKTSVSQSVSVSLNQSMPGLAECSLVASPYSAFSTNHGTLAVLGPVRMNYARIMPMVDFAAQILSQCLKSRF
ncbi:MAG: heat-inducible transcription repressor HrcA [Deltaproteobacteria bacterium HGW-Deltaproteobacteria-18]|nr:MAG: heat-inducible transcription repressor HrcA [Deltaproteobacteria bacterium HGW-Deltaproteobacteria-18]